MSTACPSRLLPQPRQGRPCSDSLHGYESVLDRPIVRAVDTGAALVFDENEWTAFRLGAIDGEFDPSRAQQLAST